MSSKQTHRVAFSPSGRSAMVPAGRSLLAAAEAAGEPLPAECAGRGACGKCLVQVLEGDVPVHRVLREEAEGPHVLACQTVVRGPLRVRVLGEAHLPRLISRDRAVGSQPLRDWSSWPLQQQPLPGASRDGGLGVALDVGTTTLRLLLIRLADGVVVGEASRYNPQILLGADLISRIVAFEKGRGEELTSSVRQAVAEMVEEASENEQGRAVGRAERRHPIGGYVVAGNLTMIHLLLGADPSGIRQVPSSPTRLAFEPVAARQIGWPGDEAALVHVLPAAGGWVGGDIVAGIVRVGFSRQASTVLYVDLGTNGEIAIGGEAFAIACACSAGPAFEGGGIQCGMRADRGAVSGAAASDDGRLELSVIGGGGVRGICGSGLIALCDALFRAGWIDRRGCFGQRLPSAYRVEGRLGVGCRLSQPSARRSVVLWERDIASLIRAKAAVFSGIRTLIAELGIEAHDLQQVIVSGNFGRFLNLPAAVGIGLLPNLPLQRYTYVDNGALEGAALALLARGFGDELSAYLQRITYVDLADSRSYMDEFVAASFLPHTNPELLG